MKKSMETSSLASKLKIIQKNLNIKLNLMYKTSTLQCHTLKRPEHNIYGSKFDINSIRSLTN
jgi:hypothetical protein